MMKEREERSGVILAIGVFKLVKALLLVAAGLGALKLLHGDAAQMGEQILEKIPVAPGRQFVERTVGRIGLLDEKQLHGLAFGTFAYAAVFLVEGVGLLMRKTWAEWLTVIVTASFIPLEVVHAVRHASAGSIAGIAVNVAIVVYLVVRRLRHRKHGGA
ncbi:MAG: DUF2127 domain-containing protein [Deltaproteobacteria bacterium]|nr:MAG: DUF2127 domain-containing protein [Deltaproteobacteria bacterium]